MDNMFVDPSMPNTAFITDLMEREQYNQFWQIMREHDIQNLALASRGGSLQTALIIGDWARERGWNTFIPSGYKCQSACTFIHLSGAQRFAGPGQLGVHQMIRVEEGGSEQEALNTAGVVIDYLAKRDMPIFVVQRMFNTLNTTMHLFDQDEIDQLNAGPSMQALADQASQVLQNR